MLGTLVGGLEARGVKLEAGGAEASVIGENELRDGMPVLTRITVHYRLRIPSGSRETVDRLLSRHKDKCPTAQSLRGAVEVDWQADIREV